uniref:Uncharacterized protein n=1 Tax=Cyanothece sp. (strain PCC 7425 / ATCC 29141) TaxID=395961 RepID=B8HUY3_CYAP4
MAKGLFKVSIRGAMAPVLSSALLSTIALAPALSQSAGDIVVIGNSPAQWAQNQTYWNQLLGLTGGGQSPMAAPPAPGGDQATVDPQVLQQQLIQNIQISNLRLVPIIKLNGSSELMGSLTNRNAKTVTVSSVNFEVLDAQGNLLQTGSAVPQPATVAPGQTVTFQTTLPTVPPDSGAKVRLGRPAIQLQGGV